MRRGQRDTRPFPIGGFGGPDGFIPWWLAEEAHYTYAQMHTQSLTRIAERGGFGADELVALLRGREAWRALGHGSSPLLAEQAKAGKGDSGRA